MEPITTEEAQHKNNAYLRNQLHWYCEQVLDILSPGQGKALYSFISTIEIQHANQTTQTALNCILDSLVELYLYGSDWHHQRLAFVQLCGVFSCTELNCWRLHNRKNIQRNNYSGDSPCPIIIKWVKYMTGGNPYMSLITTNNQTHVSWLLYLSFVVKAYQFLKDHGELPQTNYRSLLTQALANHYLIG